MTTLLIGGPVNGHTDFITLLTDPELLQLMLFACPDGVLATDENGKILVYAGHCEAMFGFQPVQVMDRSYSALIADPLAFERLTEELAVNGHVSNYEIPARRKSGVRFSAAVSAAVMKDRYGVMVGTIFYIRDNSRVHEIQETLRRKNAQLNDLVSKLDHLANHDQLTGLLRRGSAVESAENELLSSDLDRKPFGVALFDLDQFKSVNDSYGHLVGDGVLATIGGVLQRAARQNDIIGRFGGEEFIAFLPDASLEAVTGFAERVRIAVERTRIPMNDELSVVVTLSAGVAAIPQCADSLNEALRIADDRLYAAKRTGRNRVVSTDLETGDHRSVA